MLRGNQSSDLWNNSAWRNETENTTGLADISRDISMYIIFGPMVILISTATIVLHFMLLVALSRCNRMPKQIKWLSFNFVISDIFLLFVSIVLTVALITLDPAYFNALYYTRVLLVSCLYGVNSSTTVGFAIERLVTLLCPFSSRSFLRQRNCVAFLILIWVINTGTPVFIFAWQTTWQCQWEFTLCDISLIFDAIRIIFASLFGTNSIIIVCSFIKIVLIVKLQLRKIHQTTTISPTGKNREYQLTRVIARLIMVYTILHMPILVYCIIFVVRPELQVPKIQLAFQTVSYVCAIANSYISMYLYIWKIPESRLKFLQLCCCCSKRFQNMSNELKIQIYNIPPETKSTKSSKD